MTALTPNAVLEIATLEAIAEIDPDAKSYFVRTNGRKSVTVVTSTRFRVCDIHQLRTLVGQFESAANR
jgi:hypothetical protein